MFGGSSRQQAPRFITSESELRLRPYNQKLSELTGKICGEIGLGESDVCLFETRLAFDCLLRQKVQKMGGLTDNLGACVTHINTMKANIEKEGPVRTDFAHLIDGYLDELNYMPRSFV